MMIGLSTVLKKTSPNGKLTLYLRCRDYSSSIEPIDGIVNIDTNYLRNRKVFAKLIAHFSYGKENEEVMGIRFYRDLCLASTQVYPAEIRSEENLTTIQSALINKLSGQDVYPFTFYFPEAAPTSVFARFSDKEDNLKIFGISYHVKVFVGEDELDIPHRRNSIKLCIRKIQYVLSTFVQRPSSTIVNQHFSICSGNIELETFLHKQIYQYDEQIPVNISVQNSSNKRIKKIQVTLFQKINIQMLQCGEYKCILDDYILKTGCPINPKSYFKTIAYVTPTLNSNKGENGIALNGYLKPEDCNLASSTHLFHKVERNAFGIIVRYFIRIKLHLGLLHGNISAYVPFVLMPMQARNTED